MRATKYPVTGRGGKGYAILQRGSLDSVVPAEAEPVPSLEEIGESRVGAGRNGCIGGGTGTRDNRGRAEERARLDLESAMCP